MTTTTAAKRWRVGRLQIGFRRHIHTYTAGDNRYVFQPYIIWDYGKRKETTCSR